MKNNAANTAVNFENNVLVPRAPNTVPDAPAPNPAPASAPLPFCRSTRPMIISASNTCTNKRNPRNIRNLSVTNGRSRANLLKLIGAQGSAAHQSAVDVGHRKQLRGIAALPAAAVKDAQMARYLSILRVNAIAQEGMHLLRLRGRGGAAGADGPHRLIGKNGPGKSADSVHGDHRIELPRDHRLGVLRLTFLQGFPDAQHRTETCIQGRGKLAGYQRIILVIPAAPLRVPHDHIAAAHVLEHGGAHLAGERTAGFGADILR